MSVRLADREAILDSELLELIDYAQWLYARRGRLVEWAMSLAREGRLSADELSSALGHAQWTEEDDEFLKLYVHGTTGKLPRWW